MSDMKNMLGQNLAILGKQMSRAAVEEEKEAPRKKAEEEEKARQKEQAV